MLLAAWSGVWATRKAALPRRWMLWASRPYLRRLDRDACRLARHRDRQAAWLVTGILKTARRRRRGLRRAARREPYRYIITYTVMLIAYFVVLTHLRARAHHA